LACRSQFDVHEQVRSWPNWSGDVRFFASKYWEPAHSAPSVHDGLPRLVDVVARATDEDQSMHAIGSGWAFEDLAASDDWVISLKNPRSPARVRGGRGRRQGVDQGLWSRCSPPPQPESHPANPTARSGDGVREVPALTTPASRSRVPLVPIVTGGTYMTAIRQSSACSGSCKGGERPSGWVRRPQGRI
jgi:hypothetical protein